MSNLFIYCPFFWANEQHFEIASTSDLLVLMATSIIKRVGRAARLVAKPIINLEMILR